ncbi:MAG: ComF family protein [Deltaproteobacteria bacterium]|nr:ComF family protein [Deltaproteobacteria bacterium]
MAANGPGRKYSGSPLAPRPGLAGWLRLLAGLAFPRACPECGAPPAADDVFCPACAAAVDRLVPSCPRCGSPAGPGETPGAACAACRREPPPFEQAFAPWRHAGPPARAVADFKYRYRWATGWELAQALGREIPPAWLTWAQVAAPVPLHPRRLLRRGFNQSLVLARGLARAARQQGGELPVAARLLARLRHTRPQVGLNDGQRRQNVAGAFGPGREAARWLTGRRVLLVDDVCTTGATVAECARVLLAQGAQAVRVVTLTRAGHEPAGLPPRQP